MTRAWENLRRAGLAPVERAEHIEEWRRLTAENIRQVAEKSQGRPTTTGASATARTLGVSELEVRRATKIASLPPETRQQAREERWPASRLLAEATPKPVMAPACSEFVASAFVGDDIVISSNVMR